VLPASMETFALAIELLAEKHAPCEVVPLRSTSGILGILREQLLASGRRFRRRCLSFTPMLSECVAVTR
jgi:hypothetical protein